MTSQRASRTGARRGVASSLLLVPALLAGCSSGVSEGTEPDRRVLHTEGRGPLSASAAAGGTAIEAPGTAPWSGTFGGFVLCSTADADDGITLQGIQLTTPVRPARVDVRTRTVLPVDLAGRSPARLKGSAPFGSSRGEPPRYDRPAGRAAIGTYTASVQGVVVTERCDASIEAGDRLTRGVLPDSPLTELLFTLRVGRRGGSISNAYVDYTAGGAPYTLHLQWQMIACGRGIADRSICAGS